MSPAPDPTPRPQRTPTHGVHVMPGEVPEGCVPPSVSMATLAPRTDDVPDEWVRIAVRTNADRNHGDLCGCDAWPERCVSGFTPTGWEHGDEAHIIATVAPLIARQVREQVAAAIKANPANECSGAVAECARIARGVSR